ncbi:MAG: single-stranded-DNA-specific exonuclease RecJ [Gemmatimonas sp.]|nr:single-stranded-DNA-specific exonuclease RecJ [Gemmatimonas sp.]
MTAPLSPAPPVLAVRPRWLAAAPADPQIVAALASDLRLPEGVARLLVRRGYSDAASARAFLRPSRTHVHSPTLLAGMAEAVDRLIAARDRSETILVHGDYDVDGICATALLVRALAMMGVRAVPFVPHRLHDGYDFGTPGIAAARAAGAALVITVDCGVVAHGPIRQSAAEGVDVIVTDHHTPGPALPSAHAVVNPNRKDCSYPEKSLCGAAIAFKLVEALAREVGFPEDRLSSFLDLVAIATVADLAPLTAENRALVRWGLAVLARTPNAGLRALIGTCGLSDRGPITAGQIGYVLAPRLNAVGRMGDAMRGVRLLLTDDEREAHRLATEMEQENGRRRDLDEQTLSDALRMLEQDFDPERDWGVVLASDRWHPGVIGIVASRVVERIHRPTVLISLGSEEGKGSGRSIVGFHLQAAFVECNDLLLRYGGHRAAAGCSIRPSQVGAFRNAFNEVARRRLEWDALTPTLQPDDEISIADANLELLGLVRHFAPFGIGNPTPIFTAHRVGVAGKPRIVGKDSLKLTLVEDGVRLEGIGFGMADRLPECSNGRIDVAFRLEENGWRGRYGTRAPTVQARLVDLRPAG